MKNAKKFLAAVTVFCLLMTLLPSVSAQWNSVIISNEEEWNDFAKECTLDTASVGKTVALTADLDFGDADFAPVPTFGGTFYGNDHTIRGIELNKNGSYVGVFRFVQKDATVTGLHVEATVTPCGSKTFVGGITGENAGVIDRCSFSGTVKGTSVTGGIAGNNTESGQIVSCDVSGSVDGETSTGGVVGKNSGLILNCISTAAVNTVYEEKKTDLSEMETDAGAIVENYRNEAEKKEEERLLDHSDTGGIVGMTRGTVQGCCNRGTVGYPHVGYNVGGVAGRQSGYLLGCENYGTVRGRKDVGGVVGQMEPYLLLEPGETADLQTVRSELEKLHTMVNRFLTDSDRFGADADGYLSEIAASSEQARDHTESMLHHGVDFADENLAKANEKMATLSNTLTKTGDVFDRMETMCDDLTDSVEQIADAIDEVELSAPDWSSLHLQKTNPDGSEKPSDMDQALEELIKAERYVSKAISRSNAALGDLSDAIGINDPDKVRRAVADLSAAVKEIVSSKQSVKSAIERIEEILNTDPQTWEEIGLNVSEISEQLAVIRDNLDVSIGAVGTVSDSLDTVLLNTTIDFSAFADAAEEIHLALEAFGDAVYYASCAATELVGILDGFALDLDLTLIPDEVKQDINDLTDRLNRAVANLSEAIRSLSFVTEDLHGAISELRGITDELLGEEPLELSGVDDEFKEASDGLFRSLADISEEIKQLRTSVTEDSDGLNGDLSAISNQFDYVMNLMMDRLEEVTEENGDLSDRILDVSDEDIESTRQGKVAQCRNFGTVEADRNASGIAGAMSIEYSSDPEDDPEKPTTLRFTYRTKAVLQACVNDGSVIGKKDCVGGVVGYEEIGTVYQCENYGEAESTNGNYVGGVAGKSSASVRRCYTKASLLGKRYVGGIAGKAEVITSCCALAKVKGEENTGAVCGGIDNKNGMYRNYYVDHGLGAADGISYSGLAEPIGFDALAAMNGIPERLTAFFVTFVADDKTVETQSLQYGDDTARIRYPSVPKKEGHFGRWKKAEPGTVTEDLKIVCEYQPYVTVLASEEKTKDSGLAIALAEGEFTDLAKLHITEGEEAPPKDVKTGAEVYHLSISDGDLSAYDRVAVRIINENRDDVRAWTLQNGTWKPIEVKRRGKYALMQITGADAVVCLQYFPSHLTLILLLIAAGVAVAGGILAFLLIRKRRKKKKGDLKKIQNGKRE